MLKISSELVKTKINQIPKKIIYIICAVLVLASIITSLFFYIQYKNTRALLQNPQQFNKEQTKLVTETVGHLMDLPSDEDPTIATVTNKNKLAQQPFFAKAENGDKVLVYTNNKLAVLYRPSINKIIEVMPVTINNNPTVTPTSLTPTPKKSTNNWPTWTPQPTK